MRTILLKDLGANLPIGTRDAATGGLLKGLAHRRWNIRMEKELGKLRDKHRKSPMPRFISMMMAKVLEQMGSLAFDGNAKAEDVAAVGSMWLPDVLYAYIWLRREVIGPYATYEISCPACTTLQPIKTDLDTLEIRTVDTLAEAEWTYELVDPFPVRGNEVKALLMGPARWASLDRLAEGAADLALIKTTVLLASIRGIAGSEGVILTENDLDEMSKRDLEHLRAEIDNNTPGADLAIDTSCSRCRTSFRQSIEWGYDGFFSVSSRSQTR